MAIDTETTGFQKDGGSEELIQIGMKKENGKTLSKFFLPSGTISAKATEITGLTIEKLRQLGAEPFTVEDATEILDFVGPTAIVIMHNKKFDITVLLKAFKAVEVRLPLKTYDKNYWETRCTQEIAKQLGQPETLDELCTMFNIERPQKHDALADASATL